MSIVMAGICPHPPIMVPEVGRDRDKEVANTQQAMCKLAQGIKESGAQTLIMITPHGAVFADGIAISSYPTLQGDLAQFGAPEVTFTLNNELTLVQAIQAAAQTKNITVVPINQAMATKYQLATSLDHGITAPLYFIQQAAVNLPLVHISMGMLDYIDLYHFGTAIKEAAQHVNQKVAVLASGDLSHRLTPDAPAGYDPAGRVFDLKLVELIGQMDVPGILNLDPELIEQAGECGLRPIIMMLGALDGLAVQSEVLSYEGPFGVGYMVATLKPGAPDASRDLARQLTDQTLAKDKPSIKDASFPVQIARQALQWHYSGAAKKQPFQPEQPIPEEFDGQKAGVFVTLKKNQQLRGCIGTIAPVYGTIVEEIVANAISAATRDTRFYPVKPQELNELEISVDVLAKPEKITSLDELDPQKYGVIVSAGGRRGLLLPHLEGVDTVEQQLSIVRQKAGIGPREKVQLERFEVIRYR